MFRHGSRTAKSAETIDPPEEAKVQAPKVRVGNGVMYCVSADDVKRTKIPEMKEGDSALAEIAVIPDENGAVLKCFWRKDEKSPFFEFRASGPYSLSLKPGCWSEKAE